MLFRPILLMLLLIGVLPKTSAQLNQLTPVTVQLNPASDEILEHQNLLLTTKDFGGFANLPNRYKSSLQLVSTRRPFPPIMYKLIPGELGTGWEQNGLFQDVRIQNTGDLTYFAAYFDDSHSVTSAGYFIYDTCYLTLTDSVQYYGIDPHDFQINEKKEKITLHLVNKYIDITCLSGNSNDTTIAAISNLIIVSDSFNRPILIWDPLDHMSPCEMTADLLSNFEDGLLDWSHANSARWSNDGNIIYSFRHIGVGKIDIKTGEIIFRLGGNSSEAIPLDTNTSYALQHDFYQLQNGQYVLFSNGSDNKPNMEGLIYEVNEENKTARMVDRYRPYPGYFSLATGNYDVTPDLRFMNYGIYFFPSNKRILGDITDSDQNLLARLYLEKQQYAYQAHLTNYQPKKWQPTIRIEGNLLVTDTIPGLHQYTWYEIINKKIARFLGTGTSYPFDHDGIYTVEAMQEGVERPFYFVADPVTTTTTALQETRPVALTVFPNPTAGILFFEGPRHGIFRVIDLLGRVVSYGNISAGQQYIDLGHLPQGSYLLSVSDDKNIYQARVVLQK